jgi:hypothetical protein
MGMAIDETWNDKPPCEINDRGVRRVLSPFTANAGEPVSLDDDHRISNRWPSGAVNQCRPCQHYRYRWRTLLSEAVVMEDRESEQR